MKNQNGVAIQLWQKIEDVTTRFDTKHKRDGQADRHTALDSIGCTVPRGNNDYDN